MTLSRRTLFAALAGLVAAPFVKKAVEAKLVGLFDHRYRDWPLAYTAGDGVVHYRYTYWSTHEGKRSPVVHGECRSNVVFGKLT